MWTNYRYMFVWSCVCCTTEKKKNGVNYVVKLSNWKSLWPKRRESLKENYAKVNN